MILSLKSSLFIAFSFATLTVYLIFREEDNGSISSRFESAAGTKFQNPPSPTKRNCGYYDCLDVYKCGARLKKILVHVPDPIRIGDIPISSEFLEILETVRSSEYFTPHAEKACLFLLPVDTLVDRRDLGSILSSYSEWNSGINSLVFNILPGVFPNYEPSLEIPVGSAIIVGSGLSSLYFRMGFDVSFPTFPIVRFHDASRSKTRKKLLLLTQVDILHRFFGSLQYLKESYEEDFSIYGECSHENYSMRCDENKNESLLYSKLLLTEATFCLVLPGSRLAQPGLFEALECGCIPVIAVNSLVLPFSEVLDWSLFSVRIYERELDDVIKILKGISEKKIDEMRKQGAFVFKRYFSSVAASTKTALDILNDRIIPYYGKTYTNWNYPEISENPLSFQSTPPIQDGFTAVILTYDRLDSLFNVIRRVAETPSCSAVLIVWNNQNKVPPSSSSSWPKIDKPLKIIQSAENLLSNRFLPYQEIETECVLSMDDDILMLTPDELEFGYNVWREFPDRLVGFPSRAHVTKNDGSWKYESEWTSEISMVLTGAAFYHKYWNHYFSTNSNPVFSKIKSWVDNKMNCEDIAMNFLIANATGQAPIKIGPRKKFRCATPQCLNVDMISGGLSHMTERTECINLFAKHYRHMPLRTIEFRADPVLYKDLLSQKLLKFPNIGSL